MGTTFSNPDSACDTYDQVFQRGFDQFQKSSLSQIVQTSLRYHRGDYVEVQVQHPQDGDISLFGTVVLSVSKTSIVHSCPGKYS